MKAAVESADVAYADLRIEEKIRVLHVDDDAAFLAVTKQCLEEQNQFQVDTALSAEEAVKKLRDSEYDVIVADYLMPGKNGLELLKELRQEGIDVPFILLTCKSREEVAIEALNSGVEQYIPKGGDAEATYEELKRGICNAVKKRKAEKLLKECERRFRQINKNMQDILLLTDENLICTHASSSIKWILGYEPSEIIGKSIYQFVHIDDWTKTKEAAKKAFEDRSVVKMELRCKRADGNYTLVEGTGKTLTDENGKITGTVITFRDTTEQKRMEQTLKESEEEYRKLFEETMDAIFVADAETGILVDCNRAAGELTGRSKSELIGMHERFLHPPRENEGGFSRTFQQHLRDPGGVTLEDQIITKKGEIKDVTIKANMIEVKGRKMLQGVFRDITESKRIHEKARFQALLLNAVGQAVVATDMKGNITYWNSAAEQLYGWTEAEVLGRNIVEVTPAETSREQATNILNQLIAGESWSGEFLGKRRDGTLFPAIVTDAPITNEKGEFIGIVGVSTDITEQKWMQEVFDEAIGKVTELNEKLQVVGSLTRHDIRNKLSAVNGRIFLLKKRLGGNEEALLQLKELELAAQQTLDIMEFERIYEQVGVEELKLIDVEKHFNEAVALFSDLKGAESINECHGLTVLADSLLRQLFYNLIDDSLKYGEKIKNIRVHYKEEENQLKLIYEDDGVGIPEEIRSNLFSKGFGKGTGYGLYLIKRICEAYGWTIQETGKQGQGAQFTMTIPKISKDGKNSYQIS
jgi:PAS domain S-box-containing protein